MRKIALGLAVVLLLIPHVALGAAKLVSDPKEVARCGEMLATISDDDMDDFKEKASKKGGNTILVTGHTPGAPLGDTGLFKGKDKVSGYVYNCPEGASATEKKDINLEQLERRVRLLEDVLASSPEYRDRLSTGWLEMMRDQPKVQP